MKTISSEELDRLREIISKLVQGDFDWLETQYISVGDKNKHWILNYSPEGRNEYNCLVRGLVVEKPQDSIEEPLRLIKSFPFIRFFNHGELQAATVNFADSEMIEKMDGTMVGVYFPYGDAQRPEFHTRKMMSVHEADTLLTLRSFRGKKFVFLPLIRNFVEKLNFNEEDIHFTYIFEFIHEASTVITKYQPSQYGLYLLAGRDLRSYNEIGKVDLDRIAQRIGANRPRYFNAIEDREEIERFFKIVAQETPDFEGAIFQDRVTGERVKLKDKDYVMKHHMLDSTHFKRLVPLVLKGEEEEILVYLPHVKEKVDSFKTILNQYIDKAYAKILHWQAKGLYGRELAVAMFGENPLPKWQLRLQKVVKPKPAEDDPMIRSLILKYIQLKSEEDIRRAIYGELAIVGERNGKALMDIIGLAEEKQEEDPSQVGEI